MRRAILLVEGRGQAIHLREDANLSVLHAARLARRLRDRGDEVHVRVILDPGESVEEYSILCHAESDTLERYRGMERHAMVREIRGQLPIVTEVMAIGGGMRIDGGLFFAAAAARITAVNLEVIDSLWRLDHPLVDRARIAEYEALLAEYVGAPYLDLEERVARDVLREFAGEDLDVAVVSRREGCPTTWLHDEVAAGIIDDDLARKERSGAAEFRDRLIGLFTGIPTGDGEQVYFNSPVCVRQEHGKVRIIARDRFSLLGIKSSERMTFARFRELVDAQNRGQAERLLMLKYPYTARCIAAGISREVEQLAGGDVHVFFVEGVAGSINPMTSGLIDAELRQVLAGRAAYHRLSASTRAMLPCHAGGLPLMARRLWEHLDETIADDAEDIAGGFGSRSGVAMTPA